jgi:hypothetical protein
MGRSIIVCDEESMIIMIEDEMVQLVKTLMIAFVVHFSVDLSNAYQNTSICAVGAFPPQQPRAPE